ncbi:MAG TPA: Spy/CpxP family protein refolding chaperone [Acetobacteraceae bacterium]|nr:Spy/CpxP family protein refolding chaperone [Acetobacteraceae bacterium]
MNGKFRLAFLVLLAPLALPVGALAQSQAQTGQAQTGQAQTAAPPAGGPETAQQYIDQLHATLQITPAQQPQWDRFAQAMTGNAESMHQAFAQRGAALGTMNAAQNMQSYAELAALHARNMQTLANAFQALYATMTPEQQRNADAVFRTGGAPVGHHHHETPSQ